MGWWAFETRKRLGTNQRRFMTNDTSNAEYNDSFFGTNYARTLAYYYVYFI